MKFSDISAEEWKELQPYLDTCLLPVTGLTGREQPWETTEALEDLRDWMDMVEIPFRGRVVTYPAMHYAGGEDGINEVCRQLKNAGFRYVILISSRLELNGESFPEADLALSPTSESEPGGKPRAADISRMVQELWR
ncbi:hypothetical protein PAE9249_01264 [Paenibacillus sp. CECT 9249]|uniref:DUF2487 family protein n=1 Tax=Paenibacillus sp. CECT 9249 TaxID=2845385 RepID=UPI001E5E1525|nr:DUF2487 family protein [Paenibacillus sp. CECT 9249]CAH0118770.1 hypothetical protein PAE9249_01264 [Paenibacillus sp. CECT 9249]